MARTKSSSSITAVTHATCKIVETAALAELEAVAARLGLVVRSRGGSFAQGVSVTLKFEFSLDKIDDSTGVRVSKEAEQYKTMCELFGLQPEWLGKTMRTGKGDAKIVGLMPRRTKMPVLLELADGRRMKCSETIVIAQLAVARKRPSPNERRRAA